MHARAQVRDHDQQVDDDRDAWLEHHLRMRPREPAGVTKPYRNVRKTQYDRQVDAMTKRRYSTAPRVHDPTRLFSWN